MTLGCERRGASFADCSAAHRNASGAGALPITPRPVTVVTAQPHPAPAPAFTMALIDAYPIPGFREPVNCWTHLAAVPVFLVLGVVLVHKGRGNTWRQLSLAVLVVTTVFLLSMSAVFHMLGEGIGRDVMRHLDIAGVFALIAGTATPIHAILFRGFNRWAPLLLIWSVAITGITLRTIFSASLPSSAGNAIFVLMGWGGAVTCVLLWRRYGPNFIGPLFWGGIAYTLGAVLLTLHWPVLIPGVVGYHEFWHLFVLAGISLHWQFVFRFAGGPPAMWPPIEPRAEEQVSADRKDRVA